MKKKIVCPAIYKHFKGMHYATMCCSKFIKSDDFFKLIEEGNVKFNGDTRMSAFYSEDFSIEIDLYKIKDKYYHIDENIPKELVVYRPLYPFRYSTVARPKDMFLSKVDKEKYPDVRQEYRFELVKYR